MCLPNTLQMILKMTDSFVCVASSTSVWHNCSACHVLSGSLSDLGWLFKRVFFHLFNLLFFHSIIVMADPTGAQNWRYGSEYDKTWFICPKSLELHWAIIQSWECDADECYEGEVNCSLSTKQLSPANSQTRVLSRMCLQR